MKSIVKKITECNVKKSDHDNGYFIQAETWGSCFFRFTTNYPDEIWIKHNNLPSCFHTYTKIPRRLAENIFHIYVNYKKGNAVKILLPAGGRILGFDTPQPSGEYWNRSFLVMCPESAHPVVKEVDQLGSKDQFVFQKGDSPDYICNVDAFFRGRDVQHMYVDAAGYQTIPAAAGADKFDVVNHYEGAAIFQLGEVVNIKIENL